MSCIIDIKCDSCEKTFEYDKGTIHDYTPKGICCTHCGSTSTRRGFTPAAVCVGEGHTGNAANGYTSQKAYKPATIGGTIKGKKVYRKND